jgi:AcrR family transcriptional regulator
VESELLAAAEAVLVRDGPSGLIVRAVAAEAGTAQMSVYNRFGGRNGLVNALLIIGFERLRAAMETAASGPAVASDKPDMLARLRDCGLRYRDFALANRHFYAIMFEDAIPHEFDSPQVWERARDAVDVFIRLVEMTALSGQIAAPDARDVAQRIWSSVHGAVGLELKGIVLTADPAATYEAMLDTIFRGLAP